MDGLCHIQVDLTLYCFYQGRDTE